MKEGSWQEWWAIYQRTGDPTEATKLTGYYNSVTERIIKKYNELGHDGWWSEANNIYRQRAEEDASRAADLKLHFAEELKDLKPAPKKYKPPEPGFLEIKKPPKKEKPLEEKLLNLVPTQFKELAAELKKLISSGGDLSTFPWWKFLPNPGAADQIVHDLLAGKNPKKYQRITTAGKKGKKRQSAKKGLTKKIQKRHKTCKTRVKELQAEIKQLEKDLKELRGPKRRSKK